MGIAGPWDDKSPSTQKNTGHTPGPWNAASMMVFDDIDRPICDTYRGIPREIEECEANARLIACAPSLLQALEVLTGHVDQLLSTSQLPDDVKSFEKALYVAFRTISKARGE